MTTRTMVYKAATDATDAARLVENEHGKWEWQIIELEDGQGPPDGWQSTPFATPAPKAPRKSKPEPVKDADGNSDGN